ncbi:hypothetical protein [Falsirhodobacter halotolerans]|uniref:hypothetical protein n=1 Tax=Falsirhodobacter halotolerans TaxID=1146892 RepID=UPI001FD1427D|nr:hypothetical protein [Falsirhodobacter halotolerans]MCJ8138579.1 hypothetical protein [Falsirhodobacter halotolerans]
MVAQRSTPDWPAVLTRTAANRIAFAALACAALTACTPAAYMPGSQVVTIDGREHTVRRSGDTYTAQMNRTLFGGEATEAEVYVGNLRAIREVSGCPVEITTVENENRQLSAKLACSEI